MTAAAIAAQDRDLRVLSAYYDLTVLIDLVTETSDDSPEGRIADFIRDGLLDLRHRAQGFINRVAAEEAEREASEADALAQAEAETTFSVAVA